MRRRSWRGALLHCVAAVCSAFMAMVEAVFIQPPAPSCLTFCARHGRCVAAHVQVVCMLERSSAVMPEIEHDAGNLRRGMTSHSGDGASLHTSLPCAIDEISCYETSSSVIQS